MNQALRQLYPDFEEELLNAIEATGTTMEFAAGEQLMRTGQYFRSTMLMNKGLVKVYREDEEGNEFFMYYLQPGQACALSMICASKQMTSEIMAKAITDTEVLSIPLDLMDEWMVKYKSWYKYVLETYRSRFEELLNTIDHIAFRAMDERLAFYLKRHVETLKSNRIEISHQVIADELNSSREVISRLLKKMEQLGKVSLHRNSIEVIKL